MICFFQTRGHEYTLAKVRKSPLAPAIEQMGYDELFRQRTLPTATHIFTDLERLGYWDLELAAEVYLYIKKAGLKVWNNPARFKNRYTLLRLLHQAGLNDFNAYPVHELASIRRYPVFVRKVQDHRSPLSDLLNTAMEVEAAVADAIASGVPEANLVIIEFAAEPFRPGFYRKFSSYRIGNAIVPHVSVHDRVWAVKYGFKFDGIDDIYQQEHALIEQNAHAEHIWKAFELAGIEYGRADYGFFRGRLQIYEINTNPDVGRGGDHPSAVRAASENLVWEKYHAALRDLDSPPGPRVRVIGGKTKRWRSWKNIFDRTRKAP